MSRFATLEMDSDGGINVLVGCGVELALSSDDELLRVVEVVEGSESDLLGASPRTYVLRLDFMPEEQ